MTAASFNPNRDLLVLGIGIFIESINNMHKFLATCNSSLDSAAFFELVKRSGVSPNLPSNPSILAEHH
jgi:hypothetical protein